MPRLVSGVPRSSAGVRARDSPPASMAASRSCVSPVWSNLVRRATARLPRTWWAGPSRVVRACRYASIARSRSATSPVRRNRVTSRTPVLYQNPAVRKAAIAASRSAASPVRSNLVFSAPARLPRKPAWSGWPGVAAATARRFASTTSSRSAGAWVTSNLARSAAPSSHW
ncbi:hypothetical protein [Microbispora sp. GKU 823]|uniref:hypothetical protein n=1 Tax=Microbispora sp. GKU 823 TaxID=1652100 RepID=UPI0035646CBC